MINEGMVNEWLMINGWLINEWLMHDQCLWMIIQGNSWWLILINGPNNDRYGTVMG